MRIRLTMVAVSLLAACSTSFAFGQAGSMRGRTSNGSLDVLLEPIWEDDGNVEFNVTFLNPGSMVPRQHEDYDFRILKDGSEVFSAAKQTGQFLIHTAESTVHIPYTFEQNGGYTVEVTIYGLGFPPVPIDPESAEFPIQVTPEFPTGALSMVLLMVGGIVVCSRFRNPV